LSGFPIGLCVHSQRETPQGPSSRPVPHHSLCEYMPATRRESSALINRGSAACRKRPLDVVRSPRAGYQCHGFHRGNHELRRRSVAIARPRCPRSHPQPLRSGVSRRYYRVRVQQRYRAPAWQELSLYQGGLAHSILAQNYAVSPGLWDIRRCLTPII
jgi:hypothetical protein